MSPSGSSNSAIESRYTQIHTYFIRVHWSSQTPGLLYTSFLFCEQKEERAIKQFQLKTWTEGQIVPSNLDSMIEVIEMVYDWMKQNGKGPITVHCMLVSTVKLRNFRSYFRKFICVWWFSVWCLTGMAPRRVACSVALTWCLRGCRGTMKWMSSRPSNPSESTDPSSSRTL